MEIKLVKSGGFCFGVKRAVDVALKSADEYKNKNIFTIGHIIHNNDIVKKLEERNILHVKLEDVSKIKESVVILRSHGVEKHLIELLKKITI
jgi:4-hydroxy-3-methylbut-2-enyl diphosphate reductase